MNTIEIIEAGDTNGERLCPDDLNRAFTLDGTNLWIDRLSAIEEIEANDVIGGFSDDWVGFEDQELAEYLIMARTDSHPNHPEIADCQVRIIR